MPEQQIRFDDGASYEQMMGVWSRLAGAVFLDWLKPDSGLRWIDWLWKWGVQRTGSQALRSGRGSRN